MLSYVFCIPVTSLSIQFIHLYFATHSSQCQKEKFSSTSHNKSAFLINTTDIPFRKPGFSKYHRVLFLLYYYWTATPALSHVLITTDIVNSSLDCLITNSAVFHINCSSLQKVRHAIFHEVTLNIPHLRSNIPRQTVQGRFRRFSISQCPLRTQFCLPKLPPKSQIVKAPHC